MNEIVRDIDVTLMRTFIAVVEAGGMTKAANLQNLTQAAVSQQVKRLEELFGEPLFDRSLKQLQLTAKGERFLSHAKRMVRLNDEIWSTMTSPTYEGEIHMGVPCDIFRPYLPSILRSFAQTCPKIDLIMHGHPTTDLHRMLEEGSLDLIITTDEAPGGEMLIADNLVWVGLPGGQAHRQSPLPVAFGDERCAFRSTTLRRLAEAGLDWKLTCHLGSYDPIIAILEADLAVAPFLSQSVPADLEIVPESKGLPALAPFYINMYLKQGQNAPAIEELAQHIRNGFAGRFKFAA